MKALVKRLLDSLKTLLSTRARKAWTAGIAAGGAAFTVAIADGNLTAEDASHIAGAAVAIAVLVFLVPNAAPTA